LRQSDPKQQAELLNSFEFKQAAMAPGASPALSGIAPTTFKHLRDRQIEARYPEAVKAHGDYQSLDSVVGNHIEALAEQIRVEKRALNISSTPAPPSGPTWE
jgi:hypothetical protein